MKLQYNLVTVVIDLILYCYIHNSNILFFMSIVPTLLPYQKRPRCLTLASHLPPLLYSLRWFSALSSGTSNSLLIASYLHGIS